MKVCRRVSFNSAHRLYRKDWSEEKNDRVFGKCNNPNYHGHNYVMEVWIEGDIDQETGYVIDLKILKDIIQQEIVERFDHRNLNLDCTEFNALNPTAENIIMVSWNILRERLDAKFNLKLKLWETENNIFEYAGN